MPVRDFSSAPYVMALTLVALIDATLSLAARQRRRYPGAINLTILMLAFAFWSLAYACELGASTLAAKLFWAKVEYLGIALIPPAWFQLALKYVNGESKVGQGLHWALLAVPALTILAVFSNELHGLFWHSTALDTSGAFPVLVVTYGPAFWLHTAYSYVMLSCGSILLSRAAWRTWTLFRWQASALVIAAVVPWIGNVAYLLGYQASVRIDLTPFASVITGALLLWTLYHFQLFDLAPIARNAVLQQIRDAILVLDAHDRIIDANSAAVQLVGQAATQLLGRPAAEGLARLPDLAARIGRDTGQVDTQWQLQGTDPKTFDLRVSSLSDRQGRAQGRLIVLHDITEQKRSEERYRELLVTAQRQAMEMSLLGQVRTAMARELEMAPLLRSIVETVAQSLGYTQVSIYLLRGDLLVLQHQVGYEQILTEIPISKGIAGRTVRTGQAQFVPEVRNDPAFVGAIDGVVSEICVPLYDQGTLAGILNAESRGASLTEADLRLLQAVAQQAGLVITKARLYAEVCRNETRYRTLVETSPDLIALLDPQGNVVMVNERISALLGITPAEAEGRNVVSLLSPTQSEQNRADLYAALDPEIASHNIERTITRGDGSQNTVEINSSQVRDQAGNTIGLIVVMRDISERYRAAQALRQAHEKLEERVAQRTAQLQAANERMQRETAERLRLEDELRQAQKMEAMGRLAGGVAHDFNNLLTVINGYGEEVVKALPPEDPLVGDAQEIIAAGQKAAELTRQLLAFSRRQVMAPRILNLNEVISGSAKMLRRLIGEDIQLVLDLPHTPSAVLADPTQLEQVLLNLSLNARDAMPQGGTLTVKTADMTLDEAAAGHLGLAAGAYVQLVISDTGVGMSAEVREHMFEPFFTTKKVGRGTGLGLSTVYGIVKQSNGAIEVESQQAMGEEQANAPHGTTFTIWLPRHALSEDQQRAAAPLLRAAGPEHILVVEDQAEVRRLASRMLRQLGYSVSEATSGREALTMLGNSSQRVHLILSDVVMPGMSGRQLMDEVVRAQQPAPRILLMSGYTDDSILQRGVETGMPFVHKPFTMDMLGRKVREVLDNPAT